jgi:hypothetical protein
MSKRNIVVNEMSAVIRATMRDELHHALQDAPIRAREAVELENSGDAAHGECLTKVPNASGITSIWQRFFKRSTRWLVACSRSQIAPTRRPFGGPAYRMPSRAQDDKNIRLKWGGTPAGLFAGVRRL